VNSFYLAGMGRLLLLLLLLASCRPSGKILVPDRHSSMTGTAFYKQAAAMNWKARDSFALKELLSGNIPSFLKKLVPVKVNIVDSTTGKMIRATYYVTPDYICLGNDGDWARINITPMAAQQIADSFHCFLPTRKMVNDIYRAAAVKLEPVPMYAFRDSTPTMWQHHLIIEGQRKGRKGLIAGIKKDVVISGKIARDTRPDRVGIYGWHQLNGQPIQPLYTGHINWWVDYSQGIRLVYRRVKVGKQWMDYTDLLKDPVLQRLLCDEEFCDFYRYPY
jgi:hypothetical protein